MKISSPFRHLFVIFTLFIVTSCANIPYQIDIDQGNQVTQAQVNQLSLGMSKEEVKFIMGTPMLNDIFNLDRWDYMQYHKSGETSEISENKLILYFENNLLVNVDLATFDESSKQP